MRKRLAVVTVIAASLVSITIALLATQGYAETRIDAKKHLSGAVGTSSRGVLHGKVLLGPICPVERIPPDPACAPKPYKTRINVRYVKNGALYKSATTDSSGRFTLSLNPGTYLLRAASGSTYPRCSDFTVRVIAGRTQNVIINCDTGIR